MKATKYTIILAVLVIIAVVTAILLFLSFTGLIFPITNTITGGYCAWVGVQKLVERDLNSLQNNTENPIQFLDVTDNDLNQIPKVREALNKVSNMVEYNDIGRARFSPAEANEYHKFLANKFEQQYNSELKKEFFVFIKYNDKTYVVDGFMFEGFSDDVQLSASLYTEKALQPITLTEDDFGSIPKIKKAIDEIGSYQVSPHASVGLPEDEQTRIQKWFEKEYKEQYGVEGFTPYFHYKEKSYSVSFAIC